MKVEVIGIILALTATILGQSTETSQNPGLKDRQYQEELADSYDRIDPTKDGWESEARASEYQALLESFLEDLLHQRKSETIASGFKSDQLLNPKTQVVFQNAGITVRRISTTETKKNYSAITPRPKPKFKTKIKMTEVNETLSNCLITLKSPLLQINAQWRCIWTETSPPKLKTITISEFEEIEQSGTAQLLSDVTASAFNQNSSYHSQLLRSTDHWRSRLPRDLGLDAAANHGLALGDVNGDGLEDLYLCQQGGLPNLLFLQNTDGTLTDFSAGSKTDWLDYCAAALFVDFDNDGDQDLVISQDFKILFMDNIDGKGHFELAFGRSTKAQSFSLTSADFDQDGFLDVYVCGYNPSKSSARAGALAEPVPFHDANNGGQNILWRNKGDWTFEDVTEQTGLNQNNTRFSFAASWEDYDQDGDLDLYLANDFGRNCLYQNQGAKAGKLPFFVNIANKLGIEDSAAGMSTNWGDFDRDGWMDLYVSNMFSSAGNRVTGQNRFLKELDRNKEAAGTFRRMARGNTLFASNGNGGFTDVSAQSKTTMARWCWGSTFIDLNNDGWLDILGANGFITAEDTGDL
ncbi:MAG: VCBS repeat-containing protein [Akkermansiaceae bacterium]